MSKVAALRALMRREGLSAYLVPSEDAHCSEYVQKADERRGYLSDFTGSAGTAVVTLDEALLWTDARYWDQARAQLSEEWTLVEDGPGVKTPGEVLAQKLPSGAKVGANGLVLTRAKAMQLEKELNGLTLETSHALVDEIWTDRPSRPSTKLRVHPIELAGATVVEKLARVREELAKTAAKALLLTQLDEIAWLFNLRCTFVIECNPVFLSYALVTPESATLFVSAEQLSEQVCEHLTGVTIKEYDQVEETLAAIDCGVLVDESSCNTRVFEAINQVVKSEGVPIVCALKSRKNEAELEGTRRAHLRDGAAKTRFIAWLFEHMSQHEESPLNEAEIAERLHAFRAETAELIGEGDTFCGDSFSAIVGSGGNGAIIHYHPEKATAKKLRRDELLLVDSGGQYVDGTTDVTRTFSFDGEAPALAKEAYTRVLMGHIDLALAVFPEHFCPGPYLDVLARRPLWEVGLDYGHGTGHGVGAFLCVHEGPHGITMTRRGKRLFEAPMAQGMLVSNEPGYYDTEAGFGIRIENVVEVVAKETPHQWRQRQSLGMRDLTLIPHQTEGLLDMSLLQTHHLRYLDSYHARVFNELSPLLSKCNDQRASRLLKKWTRPLLH